MLLWLWFYHKRARRKIWKTIHLFGKKYQKIHKFFSSNRKTSYTKGLKRQKIAKNISYRLQFIDRTRFKATSLSYLVDNLAERMYKIKFKNEQDNKKDFFLEWTVFKDNLIEYKYLCYNKNYQK